MFSSHLIVENYNIPRKKIPNPGGAFECFLKRVADRFQPFFLMFAKNKNKLNTDGCVGLFQKALWEIVVRRVPSQERSHRQVKAAGEFCVDLLDEFFEIFLIPRLRSGRFGGSVKNFSQKLNSDNSSLKIDPAVARP